MASLVRRERILIVDDEPQILRAFEDTLADWFDVQTTQQPERALELAAADQELAVIVCDQRMPQMTGDVLLGRLRTISDASRVLATGYADLESVVRAINEAKIFAFVTKPWNVEDLQLKVLQAAEHFRLKRELEHETAERQRTARALAVSEERLRLAFEASAAGLFDWNLQTGEIHYAKSAVAAGTSQPPESLLADFPSMEQRVHPDDVARMREVVRKHLEGRLPFQKLELRALSFAGTGYRWFELNAQAAWDSEGRPVRLVGSVLDIQDLKHAQTRLVQAQKLEGIGQLAAGIAHEINTPTQYVSDNVAFLLRAFVKLEKVLGAYRLVAEAARTEQPTEEGLLALDSVVKAVKLDYIRTQVPLALEQSLEGLSHVSSIVKAMKEFSHPSNGEKQLVNLHEVIESSSAVARNEWKYVAEMIFEFDQSLPHVPVLRNELSQVLLNLIVNAAHAIAQAQPAATAPSGKITIATCKRGENAEIRVSDTGTGIPEAIRSRVFEPFFTTKEVGKGTGQGLAISYSVVVDKHGGSIGFETEMGRGTTFVICLPAAPAA